MVLSLESLANHKVFDVAVIFGLHRGLAQCKMIKFYSHFVGLNLAVSANSCAYALSTLATLRSSVGRSRCASASTWKPPTRLRQ